MVQFYTCFIKDFESKINPVKMTEFAVAASRKMTDHEAAITFLTTVMGRTKISKQEKAGADNFSKIIFKCEIATHKLQLGLVEETKETMKAADKMIERSSETPDLVFSFYYRLCAEFHKKKESSAEFYRSALQYLTYTPIDTMSLAEQSDIARDLCLAALISDAIFTFGELLLHPVLKALESGEFFWMVTMLKALNVGNIPAYDALCAAETERISKYPIMIANQTLLRQKLSIAALIELIFQSKADERLISFKDISVAVSLPYDQVELLLIKALSLKLIRGTIDGVDEQVHITWAIPHALDMSQILVMKDNVVFWRQKTETTMQFVEDKSPELFT